MRIVLAPMEGLADDVMRRVLTAIGGYDWCVCEFVRVTDSPLPARAFRRICPELDHGGRTEAGTPVRVQLLGSDAERLAENAARVAALRPYGIDLNFGCPTPVVFRHGAGAALLDDPEALYRIAAAVRRAVPAAMPVTAKLRLGVADTARALDNARALAEGGVAELVVHARTKTELYRPPAHWEWLARIREAVAVPVIANGEIWTADDWRRCREISGCQDVMLARGAIADPFLAQSLRGAPDAGWPALRAPLLAYWAGVRRKLDARHAPGRLKHWLSFLRRRYPQAAALDRDIRARREVDEITAVLGAAFPADGEAPEWRSPENLAGQPVAFAA